MGAASPTAARVKETLITTAYLTTSIRTRMRMACLMRKKQVGLEIRTLSPSTQAIILDDTPPFDIHSRSYKYGDG